MTLSLVRPRPVRWLTDHAHLLPPSGRALDVACGRGRHARWLAGHGLTVDAVDADDAAIAALAAEAAAGGLAVRARVVDLESGAPALDAAAYDVVVVVHYLHRPLVPRLLEAVRPGGLLVYETFTVNQAARGKPSNPDFLLRSGELVRLVAPFEIVAAREADADGRWVASVVARRPA